jgi:L-asparaginase
MSLRIITTGGTFDKHYDPIAGQLGFAESTLPRLLARVRLAEPATLEPLMAIDSLEMTDAHRQAILAACRKSTDEAIVIIHGTDTLTDTARVLATADLPATIVLTGAMVPAEIEGSDALFNLGFACACAQTLPAGIWVAMNGQAHAWNAVRKNRAIGRFEAVLPPSP